MRIRTVLVVDDDEALLHFLRRNLEREGYRVLMAADGDTAVDLVLTECPDLVLLDVILPGVDGFEVCRRIRDVSEVPVIMLTARSDQHDIVRGLDQGADDYVVKPFGAGELVARVRAVLRRTRLAEEERSAEVFHDGDLVVDLAQGEVVLRGQRVRLRPTEYRLLAYLVQHAGKIVRRDDLISRVWGTSYAGQYDLLRTYVKYLRQRIENDPAQPQHLETVYGIGYVYHKTVSEA